MKIRYANKKFNAEHQLIIDRANAIILNLQQQGYTLSLRQLFYQFIAKDLFPDDWTNAQGTKNNQKNYTRLGRIVSDARRGGLIDWDAIEDRTRNLHSPTTWNTPADIVDACARQFDVDWWEHQSYRPEVWTEKDAVVGILEPVCGDLHTPYFSCRGYTSDSELQSAAQRLARYARNGQTPIIIHLGDHDPSGKDMTRDIVDRIKLFASNMRNVGDIEVDRIALNWDQIEQYSPPPNFAKTTDSRYKVYAAEFGDESWELDALDPVVMGDLVRTRIETLIDQEAWDAARERRDRGREQLSSVSDAWEDIVSNL